MLIILQKLNLYIFHSRLFYQQHSLLPVEQSHEGSVPLKIPFRIPAAHPTPDLTLTAPNRQLLAQAPHSMQSSISTMRALPFTISKTA
jgi:hypothetical protein